MSEAVSMDSQQLKFYPGGRACLGRDRDSFDILKGRGLLVASFVHVYHALSQWGT